MNNSLLFYLDRSNSVQIVDSESLPHTEGLSPIMLIAVAVINAGYRGVIVDEQRMANGRIFQALNTNMVTHEGRIVADLCKLDPSSLPPPQAVVEMIREAYLNSNGAV
jgi:hypothetical protein